MAPSTVEESHRRVAEIANLLHQAEDRLWRTGRGFDQALASTGLLVLRDRFAELLPTGHPVAVVDELPADLSAYDLVVRAEQLAGRLAPAHDLDLTRSGLVVGLCDLVREVHDLVRR